MTFYGTDAPGRGPGLIGGLLGFAAATALVLAVGDVSYAVARAVYSGIAAANTTNYTYCVHLIRHGRSWNFRQGIGQGSPTTRWLSRTRPAAAMGGWI